MTPQTWEKVAALFARCQHASPEECEHWAAASGSTGEHVRRLLQNQQLAAGFLETAPQAVRELRTAAAPRFPTGHRLSARYRIHRLLERGGVGEVYAAFDECTQQDVALKVAHAREDEAELAREWRLGRLVSHPHVCPFYELGHDGLAYFTMALLRGETLTARLKRPFAPTAARAVCQQLLQAVAAIHDAGLVHRDLTPANLMLEGDHAYVLDFGLAAQEPCGPSRYLGTHGYLAPEQQQGARATRASDIYSLGLIFRQLGVDDLASRMLAVDPTHRPTAHQLLT